MAEQFTEMEHERWTSDEQTFIRRLRLAYNGELNEAEFATLQQDLNDEYFQEVDRHTEAMKDATHPAAEEKTHLDAILRFSMMLSAGGFFEDAAEFLDRRLAMTGGQPLAMPRDIYVGRLRAAAANFRSFASGQEMRDISIYGPAVEGLAAYQRPKMRLKIGGPHARMIQ